MLSHCVNVFSRFIYRAPHFHPETLDLFETPGSGCTVCVPPEMKMTTGIAFVSSGLPEPRSPQGSCNGYSDVNDQGYYDLQEALTSSPKTNCIPVFDEELLLASFASPPPSPGYTLQPSNVVDIY